MDFVFFCFNPVLISFSLVWALSGHQSVTMVDRTNYDIDKTPELPLRQILGRQRVPTELCKLAADSGVLTVETFAMLGDTSHAV